MCWNRPIALDSSSAVRPPQCHTSFAVVGRVILIATVRRAWMVRRSQTISRRDWAFAAGPGMYSQLGDRGDTSGPFKANSLLVSASARS